MSELLVGCKTCGNRHRHLFSDGNCGEHTRLTNEEMKAAISALAESLDKDLGSQDIARKYNLLRHALEYIEQLEMDLKEQQLRNS